MNLQYALSRQTNSVIKHLTSQSIKGTYSYSQTYLKQTVKAQSNTDL